jgi:hypothetical protein
LHKAEATHEKKVLGKDALKAGLVIEDKSKTNVTNNLTYDTKPVAYHKIAILDSGCTTHYLKRGAWCKKIKTAHMSEQVNLPNGAALKYFATVDLSCTRLNQRARSTHIIRGLVKQSLLSYGQMCDAGYKVLFTRGEVKVIEGDLRIDGKIVIQGQRDRETGLWNILLNNTRMSIMTQEYRKQKGQMSKNVYEISKV